jgi:putative transposase
MDPQPVSTLYKKHRFPPEIISHAVWLYHRFCLSFRDVEDLLAARGVVVSSEAVRQWCLKFGQEFAKWLWHRQGRPGDTWHVDELVVTIAGTRHYLWRAVDQEGEVLDILVQKRRDTRAANRFFRKLLKGVQYVPRRLVTDKLGGYGRLVENACPVFATAKINERTSAPKCRISRRANRNGRCGGSNRLARPSAFSPSMARSPIYFVLDAIC